MGSGNVGKTSVLHRYLNGSFSYKYTQTVEDLYDQNVSIDGERFIIEFLDTSGSIEFPAMRRLAIRKANAFMLVFNIDNEESFAEMKQTWREIKNSRDDHKDIPCIVIGNKQDRENYREVEYFEALNWADNNGLEGMMLEVSSKTGENIDNIFMKLFKQISLCKAQHQTVLRTKLRKKVRIEKGKKVSRTATSIRALFSCGRKKSECTTDI
ncbi:dexamethasone-induced Ras-related protein 1-like [Pecten maximus]|uniref:dexamethasone-induced Ras-related protein 1-like n=1 Tax=Pecten maximus TaxID=6579 RepID=UPI0014588690|nr:dexamethasone-induced Ras-related protein 1-like [Pecten maximus]